MLISGHTFQATHENPGDIVLSPPEKLRSSAAPSPLDLRRRDFLIRCCQGASAALIPSNLHGLGWRSVHAFDSADAGLSSTEFHLHPHYRMPRPLDALLLKTQAGHDDFVTEKYADQIATVLAQWTSGLLQSPQDVSAIEKSLLPNFLGSSLTPLKSRVLRRGPAIEARQNTFQRVATLGREAFVQELRSALTGYSKIITAEFQVATIAADPRPGAAQSPAQVQTRVRYELVATSRDFYREQRVGYWQLTWEPSASDEFGLQNWQTLDETVSRSTAPAYVDIAVAALGGNTSYSAQLVHGTDHWRTVLDGACGIEIYGHNGVSVGDIDGDGFDDLYVCQPGGLPNRLYRNRGDGTFEDITEASGVGVLENTACALFVDIDNDGRQDLIVVRTDGPVLFLNDGRGKFRPRPGAFQFANPPQGSFTGAAAADYDRDGWLDVYFCLYSFYQGADQYRYPMPFCDANNGPPNFMFRNNRDGSFRDVTTESGLNQNNKRYSFCCAWSDYNRDGWPDLCVVNDFGRKNLYRNNGDGTFTDIAARAGVEDVGAGMSACWFECSASAQSHDRRERGDQDLYVANMWTAAGERVSTQEIFKKDSSSEIRALYQKHATGNSLLREHGTELGTAFEDATNSSGTRTGRWAWSSDAFDFDHDGFSDLYVTNGMVSGPSRPHLGDDLNSFFWRQVVANSPDDAQASKTYELGWNAINELIRSDGTWSGYERNICYANNRDGTFSDVSAAVGLDFVEDGRSFTLADIDHDGRLEIVLKNRNAPQLRVLKNVVGE